MRHHSLVRASSLGHENVTRSRSIPVSRERTIEMQQIASNKLSVGEALYNCLILGGCGGMVGGAIVGIVMSGALAGVLWGLGVAIPAAGAGAVKGTPVAVVLNQRIGEVLAAMIGLLCGAGLTWLLLEMISGLGGI